MFAAFLLPLAFSPELYHSFWAPKAALCLLLVGPGLVALAALVRTRSRTAVVACLFVGVAAVSTLLSGDIVAALTGSPNWGTGFIFVASVAGAWALGVLCSEQRRRQVLVAMVAATVVNAAVAWLQARNLVPPALESAGRSRGLMGNPVHLGALSAGGLWLLGDLLGRQRRSLLLLGPLALVAGAAQLSGGRSAVGLSALALVFAVARSGIWRGLAMAAAVVLGLTMAPAWAGDGAISGSSRAVGAGATAQVDVRGAVWRVGLGAALERPVLGWGPGRFQAATSPRSTATMSEGGVSIWKDAHNWMIDYAVTTGFVGLALLGAWLAAAGRAGAGPLAGFAAVIGLFTLVEPQSAGLTPLALLALGASSREAPDRVPNGPGWRWATGVSLAVGAAAAGFLLVGEAFLQEGMQDSSPRHYSRGAALLPPWADVSRLGARIESFSGLHSPPHRRRALALARQATRRDPTDPQAWVFLGQLEMVWGTDTAASQALGRGLDWNPWSVEGLTTHVVLAERTGDEGGKGDSCGRLKVLRRFPPACGGPATVGP